MKTIYTERNHFKLIKRAYALQEAIVGEIYFEKNYWK